jgi:hypothetical protein
MVGGGVSRLEAVGEVDDMPPSGERREVELGVEVEREGERDMARQGCGLSV